MKLAKLIAACSLIFQMTSTALAEQSILYCYENDRQSDEFYEAYFYLNTEPNLSYELTINVGDHEQTVLDTGTCQQISASENRIKHKCKGETSFTIDLEQEDYWWGTAFLHNDGTSKRPVLMMCEML